MFIRNIVLPLFTCTFVSALFPSTCYLFYIGGAAIAISGNLSVYYDSRKKCDYGTRYLGYFMFTVAGLSVMSTGFLGATVLPYLYHKYQLVNYIMQEAEKARNL